MTKLNIGVIRGGPSSEYEVSLKTGENIIKYLPRDRYRVFDIFLSKKGQWHMDGIESSPDKIFRAIDVAFNALHGEFGEDGGLQRIMDTYGVAYTGSESWASMIAMNKILAKESFRDGDIKTPNGMSVRKTEDINNAAFNIVKKIGPPWIVKPAKRGSSVGVSAVSNFDGLIKGIEYALKYDNIVLVEKKIIGREATCGILENFRGEDYYAFPVVEIVPPTNAHFFDYEVKYNGKTQEICPGRFDMKTKLQIQETAKRAHRILGCRHYSRSDFIVARDGIYLLETNTLPGMTSESLLPKAASAIGLEFSGLLEHLITLAKRK